jgi:hypothetical protein
MKQETLEKSADKVVTVKKNKTAKEIAERKYGTSIYDVEQVDAFINGANWQQEKMFSEEEVRQAIKKARDISDGKDCFDAEDISGCTEVCTYGWKFNMSENLIIEQFKKKK